MKRQINWVAIFAFAAVYIVWGSTYLAIRYAIETIPPWGLSAARYFLAGGLMLVPSYLRRESKLTKEQMKTALISGPFLVVANGGVCVIEKWIPSGVAAVVIGAMPIWIMFIGWLAFHQAKPTIQKIVGALTGLTGIALITAGDVGLDPAQTTPGFSAVLIVFLVFSSWLWAAGTLVQRKASKLKSIFAFSGWQMLAGSVVTGLLSLAFEKPWTMEWANVSSISLMALAYLIVFGSVLAFTAYSWISRNYEPHIVSTYALVNPLIAVALGAVFYSEPVGPRFLVAAVLVILGLAVLMFSPSRKT